MPGGVCAVLDYEVEMMAEYVSDMSMRLVMPNASVTAASRKFVSQVLTSTRLPSTTILLGLNYLAKRVNTLNAAGGFKVNEGQVWRMLTVSLLLGSKFLDDNTFQNRSWSEVSGIPVQELNTMENDWLRHIDWSLYVNLDKSGDYNAWLSNWKDWETNKKREQLVQKQQAVAARERLAPIRTDIRTNSQHHPLAYEGWTPEEISDYERARFTRAAAKSSFRPRENSWATQYQTSWSAAPLTPPDSGYGTPEYLNSAASLNSRYNDWFNSAMATGYRGYQSSAPTTTHASYNHRASTHQHQSYYNHYGGQGIWDANIAECNCSQCMATLHKPAHYFQHHGFGQAVVG
ncbi:uncharacterized protein JN550_003626 [Neoarthrinium moseri]|uniref:uncharacterized protein n=1 Tax=Neoarthrinium moseri TaxID=1658444 RepID=UPI001FDD2E4C|nr:uncharacterized protein JN550_003626 [Neoarthrinium moseri]KAI1872752.1 hypothetical protein JN550_003626 [Neoarthrinium moseri]